MPRPKRQLILAIVATDRTFSRHTLATGEEVWLGRCLHCNTRLAISLAGEPLSHATIEHIVPRNAGGTDELANLALACDRCNRQKGYRQDLTHRRDPRARAVIERLASRRRERWRDPDPASARPPTASSPPPPRRAR